MSGSDTIGSVAPPFLPICPISLSGQMNGINYYYADDCPVHTPYLISSQSPFQYLGCTNNNNCANCIKSFNLSANHISLGVDGSVGHCADQVLIRNGLDCRMPPGDEFTPCPSTRILKRGDYKLGEGQSAKRIRLYYLEHQPPRRDDGVLPDPVRLGLGQELNQAPQESDVVPVIEEHVEGTAYYKLRLGEEQNLEYYHVIVKL